MQDAGDISFDVGSYTKQESKGIYKYFLRNNGTLKKIGLVTQTDNPSFLAKSSDHKFLIAVNENGDEDGGGNITSYAFGKDSLKLIDTRPSGGTYPCCVTINKSGYVATANYGNGTVGLLQLKPNGN